MSYKLSQLRRLSIEKYTESELLAILSHYLHKQGSTYEKDGADIVESVISQLDGYDGKVGEPYSYYGDCLFPELFDIPFPAPKTPKFTFIDLFAGIGGFRIAMQNLGGKCVYSSEFDKSAQQTYLANYGDMPFGDITKESTKSYIPDDFDILCAGFPCQAFSLAGKRRGFEETRGTLFFDVADILRRKQPKGIFLENVKGLKIHDKGKTFDTIKNTLAEVGYVIAEDPQIVNAMNFGVPQHRERVYIIGVRKDLAEQYNITKETIQDSYPSPTDSSKTFADVKEENPVSVKYYLSTQYVQTLKNHKARHAAKGNGFGYEIIGDDQVANAIVVGGMGRERNLVRDYRLTDNSGKNTNFIYRLSNRVCDSVVSQVNDAKDFKTKLSIINCNAKLDFIGIQPGKSGNVLYNNLLLIDCCMPNLLAYLLVQQYVGSCSKLIPDLVEQLKSLNPLGFDMSTGHPFYESKMKRFLTDVALGMTAGKIWNGIYQANGGYLVVKRTGDVVCYHIYNKKEFEDYLYFNTKLDTPSTTKYGFGLIEEAKDGSQVFKLNLQIRFIK